MQDDDAILRLFAALKNNPPSLMQRLKAADADGDSQLTQQDFSDTFLKQLKVSPVDVHSLCRVAGFTVNKDKVAIADFIQTLQDRPKMRELWEQQLFDRLSNAISSKKLTIDQFFNSIDEDGSGTLSPAEFKQGLAALKIVLN